MGVALFNIRRVATDQVKGQGGLFIKKRGEQVGLNEVYVVSTQLIGVVLGNPQGICRNVSGGYFENGVFKRKGNGDGAAAATNVQYTGQQVFCGFVLQKAQCVFHQF